MPGEPRKAAEQVFRPREPVEKKVERTGIEAVTSGLQIRRSGSSTALDVTGSVDQALTRMSSDDYKLLEIVDEPRG